MALFYLIGLGLSSTLVLYFLAAVIPAIFLLRYIYNKDVVEKEPPALLATLVGMGVLAALLSIILEGLAQKIIDSYISESDPYYIIVIAFIGVAAVEEGTKLFLMRKKTWNNPEFSHTFDGVVYAAFTSLGFAAFENILYVFQYGLSVALPRAVFSIPGHLGFSVFMGIFYSRAKQNEMEGDFFASGMNMLYAYISAVFLHGFYDSCAMMGTPSATMLFYAFVIIMYIVVYRLVKKSSYNDREIY